MIWLCFSLLPLWGQTNEEIFREYQFNFNLPGARANGLGGAFIGAADDATASFANPAGLAFLNETALTLEYKYRKQDAVTSEIKGDFFNSTINIGETIFDKVNFASVNFRWKSWYFGVFHHKFLDESQTRRSEARSFEFEDGIKEIVDRREISLHLEGDSYGVGVARRLGAFKLGLSLNYMDFNARTNYTRNGIIIATPPLTTFLQSTIDGAGGSDHQWGFNLGLLHQFNERFSWGLVWREHPNFSLSESVEIVDPGLVFSEDVAVPFVVPDVLGIGLQYKLFPSLRFLADWQEIYYSQIIEDGFVIVESLNTETKDNYQINDVREWHLGLEWLLPTSNGLWVARAGYFNNPLHAVSYSGSNQAIQLRFAQRNLSDEKHYTAGVGWVLQNKLELGLAANYWDGGQEFTFSVIWRNK